MFPRGDERAVTVQIGAVLLLAIVFAALALYQVNAVPAENKRVEITHNEEVHNELQDLRNAIQTVGTDGGTQSTAVTLGTQYPSRTVATNPPSPTGRLETTGTATVTVENATVAGDGSDYDGDPSNLTGEHRTTTLAYAPAYNEYHAAPLTRIEHGFAFNDFGDAQVSLTGQPVVSDGTIRLVLLEGNLSETGSGAVTLDPTILSGPSDEVPIERENGNNITITVPTASPTAWNDTIGTTFDDGQDGARVTAYDGAGDEDGNLTIELADETYDLQVARVGIGDGGERRSDYDVQRKNGGNDGGTSPAYTVSWEDPSDQSSTVDEKCDSSDCVVVGDSVDLTMATDGTAAYANVEYAVSDPSVGSVSPAEGETNSNGTHTTTFTVDPNATDGETVDVYASSGSDGDRITLEISRDSQFDVDITGTNEPIGEGDPLEVTAEVTNEGGATDTQTIALAISDGVGEVDSETVALAPSESTSLTLTWQTTEGDAGTYEATVSSDDTQDQQPVEINEHSPPTASLDAATHETRSFWIWTYHDVVVDWSATDDDELSGGSVNEIRLYDSSGSLVDSAEISPSGTEDSGQVTFTGVGEVPDGWTAEVVVSNTHDLQDSDSKSVTTN